MLELLESMCSRCSRCTTSKLTKVGRLLRTSSGWILLGGCINSRIVMRRREHVAPSWAPHRGRGDSGDNNGDGDGRPSRWISWNNLNPCNKSGPLSVVIFFCNM